MKGEVGADVRVAVRPAGGRLPNVATCFARRRPTDDDRAVSCGNHTTAITLQNLQMSELRIGTSAFTANGWMGAFYPDDIINCAAFVGSC